jgi:hypothetical protein
MGALGSAEIGLFEGHVVSWAQQARYRRGRVATAGNFERCTGLPDSAIWGQASNPSSMRPPSGDVLVGNHVRRYLAPIGSLRFVKDLE